MTLQSTVPELSISPEVLAWLRSCCERPDALVQFEKTALEGSFDDPFLASEAWRRFTEHVHELWKMHDHAVIRGVPEIGDGASLLLVSSCLSRRFKPYRKDRVVKHFRMSPWTTELSHTLQAGHFHTDINTAPTPPVLTGIQCRVPDPGCPRYGELRVARLSELLVALRQQGTASTLEFLERSDVTMVNETSPGGWTGRIVEGGRIRFHPETLRAGQRRYGSNPPDFEEHLRVIHEAALAVSVPIQLAAGEVLLVSNTRALHYRGECSVVFQTFPRHFASREVYVLHLLDEPL